MRDIYVTCVYVAFFLVGVTTPFVLTLGYMWVDTFYPQDVTSYLASFPVALVIGAAAFGVYLVADHRAPPRLGLHFWLHVAFAAWVTITLSWAVAPGPAWDKWSWAFKTVAFAAFLPFVIRSRVQIEAFIAVFISAAALDILSGGVKTLISGSGYGRGLGVVAGNSGLAESSFFSAACMAMIPLILYLRKHTLLIPRTRWRDPLALGAIIVTIGAMIGTYARTGIVSAAVVFLTMWIQARRKTVFTVLAVLMILGMGGVMGARWMGRMDTIDTYQKDPSAYTRIIIWEWTLKFVESHPLGGGFNSYYINRIVVPNPSGGGSTVQYGRAFHNIYMEVLGEHGFPGLALYLALQITSLAYLRKVIKLARDRPHLAWAADLARALTAALLALVVGGQFIGIAFKSFVWYTLVLPVCLRQHVRRVIQQDEATASTATSAFGLGNPVPNAAGAFLRRGLSS